MKLLPILTEEMLKALPSIFALKWFVEEQACPERKKWTNMTFPLPHVTTIYL